MRSSSRSREARPGSGCPGSREHVGDANLVDERGGGVPPSPPRPRAVRIAFFSLPPPLSQCYINVPGRGRALSRQARDWKQAAKAVVADVMAADGGPPIKKCSVTSRIAIDYRSDLTNRLKLLHDALVDGGAIVDDRWIEVETTMRMPRPEPGLPVATVKVREHAS